MTAAGTSEIAASRRDRAPMIEVIGGVLGYDGRVVAEHINLAISPSEVVAVVGPSGCGKTTLLKAIAGELPLITGSVHLQGRVRDAEWRRLHVARTIQSFPLLHWHTVAGNLRLAARVRGLPAPDVESVLSQFSATHLRDRYPNTLSGGERCRASLAQASLTEPKVLLLDEPFTGLDLHVREEIALRLFSFAESHDTSMLFVTHDLRDAREYSTRVAVLAGGHPSRILSVVDPKSRDSESHIRSAMLSEG